MRIVRWNGESADAQDDDLAEEEPLEIRVRGRAISVTMRTPGQDAELAAGFLLTEGIIHAGADMLRVEHCDLNDEGNILNVLLAAEVPVDFERLTRHVFASSSCGLCGKATIESIQNQFPPIQSDLRIDAELLASLPQKMRVAQETFNRTGGLHAAALFDADGKMIVLREDVGRHNAVDKVIGHCLLHGAFPPDRCILLVSGRSSFEIMQKALAARVPIIAAVSAPSSLAATFAQESGQTLIGFLRDRRMNAYANPQRISFQAAVDAHPAMDAPTKSAPRTAIEEPLAVGASTATRACSVAAECVTPASHTVERAHPAAAAQKAIDAPTGVAASAAAAAHRVAWLS
jgi:FdhD protein